MPCVKVTVKPPAPGMANIVEKAFTVSPTTVESGGTVSATLSVRNEGNARGSATYDIAINGSRINQTKTVTLDPNKGTTITWAIKVPLYREQRTIEVCTVRVS